MHKEDQKTVPCEGCGKPLYAKDEYRDGDEAWLIDDRWYCEDCARDMFVREVETYDFI